MKKSILLCLLMVASLSAIAIVGVNVTTERGYDSWSSNSVESIDFTEAASGYSAFNINSSSVAYPYTIDDKSQIVISDIGDTVRILYASDGVKIYNPYSESVNIAVSGHDVTVTSTNTEDEIVYLLTGYTDDGSLKYYGSYKFELVLGGVSITNPDGPAINIQCSKKGSITLKDGSVNTLTDGTSYASSSEDQKATLFSEGQMLFDGNGTLNITANYKHGICSDDYIKFKKGLGTINVLQAEKDAVHANDSVIINDGIINLTASSDGIDCDGLIRVAGGTMQITSSGMGCKAIKSGTNYIQSGGSITAVMPMGWELEESGSGYDPSYTSGVKADGSITITDGTLSVTCGANSGPARAIMSDGAITISGGTLDLSVAGAGTRYTDTTGAYDTVSASCIKGSGGIYLYKGDITCNASGTGSKGIQVKGTPAELIIGEADADNTALTLTVKATGSEGNLFRAKAINSDSLITINSGVLTITSSNDDALNSSYSITINGGSSTISAGDDGVHADSLLTVNGGKTVVTKAYEGMEAGKMYFNGGVTYVKTSDDGWNAAGLVTTTSSSSQSAWSRPGPQPTPGGSTSGYLEVNGGEHYIVANGDGLDSNGNAYMNGGTVVIAQSGGGNGIIDVGENCKFYFNGGTLLGLGGSDMWVSPTISKSYLANKRMGNISSGTLITVANTSGAVLSAYKVPFSVSAGIYMSDSYTTSYSLYKGGTYSGTLNTYNYATGGTVTGASKISSR